MSIETALLLILLGLVPVCVGWLHKRSRTLPANEVSELIQLRSEQAWLKQQSEEFKLALGQKEQQLQLKDQQLRQLEAEKASLLTQARAETERLNSLKELNEQQRAELKKDWRLLSSELLQQGQQSLAQQNEKGMNALLAPLRTQLEQFQQRINQLHSESAQGRERLSGEIKTEMSKIAEISRNMNAEASKLSSALKGDAKLRGSWGETQLELTLEKSGLIKGQHYDKERTMVDEAGNHKRPDFLIRLPGNKHFIIDSKVSMNDYVRMAEAESESEREEALRQYLRSVRGHIDGLAKKSYEHLTELDSPDFVFLFIPIESAFMDSLRSDYSLPEYALRKNIVLTSHTTLIPILRTVANLWTLDQSTREVRELTDRAGDVYNQVCLLAERLAKLGKTMQTANNHYNDTVTALSGRQGLHGKVERFKALSNKANRTMPAVAHTNAQFQTLELEAIPLNTPEPQDGHHPQENETPSEADAQGLPF